MMGFLVDLLNFLILKLHGEQTCPKEPVSSQFAPLPCGRKNHGGEIRVALHCVELLNADYSFFKMHWDF